MNQERTHSLTLRLFSMIVLGMLALSVLALLSTHRLADAAKEKILIEYQQVQEMYANELDRQLTGAQRNITQISASYLADMATNPDALSDARAYEALRCQTEIITTMSNWKG